MPTNVIYLLHLVKFIRSSFMATMLLFKCLLKQLVVRLRITRAFLKLIELLLTLVDVKNKSRTES